MTNAEIVKLLRRIAASYTIKNDKKYKFQIIAYQKAADSIENLTSDINYIVKNNKLDEIPGIGLSIKSSISELLKNGKASHFDSILDGIPESIFPLLEVPGFGPKKSYKLVTHFKLNNPKTIINDIAELAKNDKISSVESFGEKSQEEIIKAIDNYKLGHTKSARMNLPYAASLAEQIITYLYNSPDVKEAYPLGSLRRKKDTIGDIDIAVSTKNAAKVIEFFTNYPGKDRILEQGDISAGIIVAGQHIDLMALDPVMFGSLLQHFTGSKNHNISLREYALKKGWSLSEKGIKDLKTGQMTTFAKEEQFYKFLGLAWIPPELREDTGEIKLALTNKLPEIIKLDDIVGDFHLHSSFPIEPSHDMGQNSMEDMVKKAITLKYNYIGFSEHNPSKSKHSPLQISKLLEKRLDEINKLKVKYKNIIRIFSLLEVDILPSGELAIEDNHTSYLDFFLVSIHSVFSMQKDQMTARIIKGLSHPKAKIFTHPTGRLINQRTGYEIDWNKLFEFCKKNNKALEINAYPSRLDLTDQMVRKAIDFGITLVINTDSHKSEQMDLMGYGVSVARRGWAKKSDILNSWEYNKIEKWINK